MISLNIPDFSKRMENMKRKQKDVLMHLSETKERTKHISSLIQPVAKSVPVATLKGHILDVFGLSVTIEGLNNFVAVGDSVSIFTLNNQIIGAEIIAFRDNIAIAMPHESIEGIGTGCPVLFSLYDKKYQQKFSSGMLDINDSWIGRTIDPFGNPLDGKGPLLPGQTAQKRHAAPPEAAKRARLGTRIDLGVKTMNLFTTCRKGQRLGLFAGSGVGKSTLMGMLARNTQCDVAVISLVGERGREVREFIEDDLGPEGLAKSVLVIATSDSSALMRREAAYSATAVAEYFRDQGKSVLLLMDSVTRFCQALREIGLSSGEIPATRGYPPSVFATLPRLLERAGPGIPNQNGQAGQITAIFSVLVEGDDHNEPIADTVRGILDGHIIMERSIAESGRYPAINVLRSLSRSVPGCLTQDEHALILEVRDILSAWDEVRDFVRLGAYKRGNDPRSDKAVELGPKIEKYLIQQKSEAASIEESFSSLKAVLGRENMIH